MKVLVGIYSPFLAWRIPEPQVAWLRGEFPDHTFTRADSDEALLAGIPDAEVAFSSLVTREPFVAARRLRWIHSPAAGIDAVVTPDGLLAALRHADAVVIAAPQTPDTWHLIGSTQLDAMKDGAILVNISRGKLIDEEALARALASGRLGGAALDVFEHEPLAATSPLWSDPRVLVTPHVSGIHERYWPDATALFADNFRRFLAGQPLRNVVDKRSGY